MSDWIDRIEQLDLSLFDAIPSQTSAADRRSLLAVQRATARKYGAYTYLEIGSHLGGSLQPHLLDPRCAKIYSIDARPAQQPDDRAPGYVAYYDDNTSARMLGMLSRLGSTDKITCIDADASEIELHEIAQPPELVLIDGEHTSRAVRADFDFCERVVSARGTILFHDFDIVYPAIVAIVRKLARSRRVHVPIKLEGEMYGIFFDPQLVASDPYLRALQKKHRRHLAGFFAKRWLKRALPRPLLASAKGVRSLIVREAV